MICPFKLLQSNVSLRVSKVNLCPYLRVNIFRNWKKYSLPCHLLSTLFHNKKSPYEMLNLHSEQPSDIILCSAHKWGESIFIFSDSSFVFLYQADGKTEQASTCSISETDAMLCVTYASPGDPATVKKLNVNAETWVVACGSTVS